MPNMDTLAEIGEMDVKSLNLLFKIPDFLQIRNYEREQRELKQFNTIITPEPTINNVNTNMMFAKEQNQQQHLNQDQSQVPLKTEIKSEVKQEIKEQQNINMSGNENTDTASMKEVKQEKVQ